MIETFLGNFLFYAHILSEITFYVVMSFAILVGVTVYVYDKLYSEKIDYDEIRKLENLYDTTESDWVLELNDCLTEPTCPTVWIYPENEPNDRYRVDGATYEQAINHAVKLVQKEMLQNKNIIPLFPGSIGKKPTKK